MIEFPQWMREAKCAEIGADLWFQEYSSQQQAAALCHGCPVTADCLQFALETDSRFGVWGGMNMRARARLHNKYMREHHPDGRRPA